MNNQNASINCDKNGSILSGAVLPTATAKLYYGTELCTGAVYSISPNVTGVKIDAASGEITFNNFFNFGGETSVEIHVYGALGGVTRGSAVMTVSQNRAGDDGTPAINYWLNLSADAIKVNKSGTVSPQTISATAYKQIGDATPVIATEAVIKYDYDKVTSLSSAYTAPVNVNVVSHEYMTFQLLVNNVERDRETVPILRDGTDGVGQQGLKGASIRGPINYWDVTASRRFCNGTPNPDYPEDALWIDVILKDDNYYYCNTSYNGGIASLTDWNINKDKWTLSDGKFEFIATKLLLAENGKINFLTGQQITLTDSDGNITGGAMGGDGINFWAGSDIPSDANFQVDNKGNITAKSGTFSGYVQLPYTYLNEMTPNFEFYNSTIGTMHLINYVYKGQYSSAPSSPQNGWCYYNTTNSRFYVYRYGWYKMDPTMVHQTILLTVISRTRGATSLLTILPNISTACSKVLI